MRNGSLLRFLIPHSSLNGNLMAEEKNGNKATSSISRGKALAGILTVLTSAGIGGYYYFQEEPPPAPAKIEVVREPEPVQGIGFIDLDVVRSSLDKDGRLAELISQETRLKLELKDALKPMLMTEPKVEQKPFDDSVWQKNAQAVISEAAEIQKRKKQAAEEYRKATEADHIKKRDEVNAQFLNEVLNIKLKLQNADNMRLTKDQIDELESRLGEIQEQRNLAQRQLMEEWVKEIAAHAEESIKDDVERLKTQAQESKEKITQEAKQAQTTAIERNKAAMEKAMQESRTRQDKRQQLMAELQSVTKERAELEEKMMDSMSDLAAKLAVINKLALVLAVKDVSMNKYISLPSDLSSTFIVDNTVFAADKEPLIIPSTGAVDLTDKLVKELQRQ